MDGRGVDVVQRTIEDVVKPSVPSQLGKIGKICWRRCVVGSTLRLYADVDCTGLVAEDRGRDWRRGNNISMNYDKINRQRVLKELGDGGTEGVNKSRKAARAHIWVGNARYCGVPDDAKVVIVDEGTELWRARVNGASDRADDVCLNVIGESPAVRERWIDGVAA